MLTRIDIALKELRRFVRANQDEVSFVMLLLTLFDILKIGVIGVGPSEYALLICAALFGAILLVDDPED